MFEDSTFESTGRIHTRSRRWMIATLALNGSILLALILIPLIYTEALPRQVLTFLLEVPAAPSHPQPPPRQAVTQFHGVPEVQGGQIVAPRIIPSYISMFKDREGEPAGHVLDAGNRADWHAAEADLYNNSAAAAVAALVPKLDPILLARGQSADVL